jgi:hypothetical protein
MEEKIKKPKFNFDQNSLIKALVIFSFIFSLLAFYFSLEKKEGLSLNQKMQIKKIAEQLKKIQQKEIVMVAPLKTTVYIEKEIPLNEIIPGQLNLSVDGKIPLNTTLNAVTNKGEQIKVAFLDDLAINGSIPINTIYSLNQSSIKINQQIPIDTKFSSTYKVSVVYGEELKQLIDELEELSNE